MVGGGRFLEAPQGTNAVHIIDNRKRCIFNGIEQNHLPFDILNKAKQQTSLTFLTPSCLVFLKKGLHNCGWIFSLGKSFFAGFMKQRQQDPCFGNCVKRQGHEDTIVNLVSGKNVLLEPCEFWLCGH